MDEIIAWIEALTKGIWRFLWLVIAVLVAYFVGNYIWQRHISKRVKGVEADLTTEVQT